MGILTDTLKDKQTVVILGHVNPDGDCIGSCLAMYNYLKDNDPKLSVSVYLGPMGVKFSYLRGYDEVKGKYEPEKQFDLCITLDASDVPRLGEFAPYLESAGDSLCIDHHITNQGMARVNVIESGASSTCEVLYGLMEDRKISFSTAECLYTGIAHDTGVFKYSNTSSRTMEIAGRLMDKGIDFPSIIDGSFYRKTYGQARLHGKAMLNCARILDGRVIYTVVTQEDLKTFGCTVKATDGIVDQLRVVEGVECAILLYETGEPSEYKASFRTNTKLDVSRVATAFGGGGHIKAAGCTVSGEVEEIIRRFCEQITLQWEEMKEKSCTMES